MVQISLLEVLLLGLQQSTIKTLRLHGLITYCLPLSQIICGAMHPGQENARKEWWENNKLLCTMSQLIWSPFYENQVYTDGWKRSPLSFICEFKAASAAGERACGLFSPIKQHSLGLFTACWYAADNSTSHDSPLAHHFLPEHASAGGDVLDLRFTLHRANANTSPLYGTLHLKC